MLVSNLITKFLTDNGYNPQQGSSSVFCYIPLPLPRIACFISGSNIIKLQLVVGPSNPDKLPPIIETEIELADQQCFQKIINQLNEWDIEKCQT